MPESAKSDDSLYFRALSGAAITASSERDFSFEGLEVSIPRSALPPFVRGGNELIIPIPLKAGTHTIQLTYSWN